MTNAVSTNIDDYTVEELMEIANVEILEDDEIAYKTGLLIHKFRQTDPELSVFFQRVQDALFKEIVHARQDVGLLDGRLQMKREELDVTDTFAVALKQDVLNPNLKNTTTRFVNLDSQFRQNMNTINTDYTLDLSDTLKDVLSVCLYSYQIPYTWYLVGANSCFWINLDGTTVVPISVARGNYTQTELRDAVLTGFTDAGFTGVTVTYNKNNGKLTMGLLGGVYNTVVITTSSRIVFYDVDGAYQCDTTVKCAKTSNLMNNTVGWTLGYREATEYVKTDGNEGQAIMDVNGTKYLILVIDDYNQNHVNNGLVTITKKSTVLKMPSYYSTDLPSTCVVEDRVASQIVLPSIPRVLTQSQMYTINEISKNRHNTANVMSTAPTSADVLAIVPLKQSGESTGKLLVDFSGSLQDSKRTYFGPVNIDRLCVKLLDDKGAVLDLNGAEWCVTLLCECLYQY
jgi:hypothetical protein